MTSPTLETEWLKIIQNQLYVRSLFMPTDVASLMVYAGRDLVAIPFELVEFDRFELKSFFVASSAPETRFTLSLELRSYKRVVDANVTANFRIRWSRIRYSERKLGFDFLYEPDKVFICVPPTPLQTIGASPEEVKHFEKCEVWKGKPLPALYSDFLNNRLVLEKVGKPISGMKNGFSGVPTAQGNKAVFETRFDAEYSNLSPPIVPLGDPYEVLTYSRDVVGTTTPGFRNKAKANLPINPFTCTIIKQQDGPCARFFTQEDLSPGGTTLRRRTYYGKSTDQFFSPVGIPSFDSNLLNDTLSKLEEKAGLNISANLAQDFLQFGQLKRLIAGNLTSIVKAAELAKQGKMQAAAYELARGASTSGHKGSVASNPRERPYTAFKKDVGYSNVPVIVASRWLELQYGWKILLKEIEDLIRLMVRASEHKPPLKRVAVKKSRRKNYEELQGPWVMGLNKGKLEVVVEESCRIGIRFSHRPEFNQFLQQTGWLNGINLAWEILPYSFVVDWVLPIGPYLSGLDVWKDMSFKDGFITQFVRSRQQGVFDGSVTNTFGDTRTTTEIRASLSYTGLKVQRSALLGFPQRDLPRFKDPASLTHALNAIALVLVRFR